MKAVLMLAIAANSAIAVVALMLGLNGSIVQTAIVSNAGIAGLQGYTHLKANGNKNNSGVKNG